MAMVATAGVLTVALLAACGSSATKAASGSSSSAKAATTSQSTSASGSSTSPAGGSPSTPSSSAKVDIGALGSSFCDTARKQETQASQDAQALTSDDPATLKKFEEQAIAELPAFEAQAPAEIKSAVATLVAADRTLFSQLDAAGWDFTKLSPTAVSALESPDFTAATEKITSYLTTKCGITESDAPTS
jgi:hypothetical protein